RGRR
ncbi:hypothetical protein FOXB_15463, partial [Fusarium oxysporum f. sp. conglutinans Fo5176]